MNKAILIILHNLYIKSEAIPNAANSKFKENVGNRGIKVHSNAQTYQNKPKLCVVFNASHNLGLRKNQKWVEK